MPMLYDVFYHDAQTGQRQAGFDSDVFAPARAARGEVLHLVNTNWDGHSYWLDEWGVSRQEAPGAVRRQLSDEDWLRTCLKPEHFDADNETALHWLDTVRRDARKQPQAVAHIRREVEAGRPVRLYARKADHTA